MKIELEFNTDNAAFQDAPEHESAWVLREVSKRIDERAFPFEPGYSAPLRDSNGNRVGWLKITK